MDSRKLGEFNGYEHSYGLANLSCQRSALSTGGGKHHIVLNLSTDMPSDVLISPTYRERHFGS